MAETGMCLLSGAVAVVFCLSSAHAGPAGRSDQVQVWQLVERTARALNEGGIELIDSWPGKSLAAPRKSTGMLQSVDGGGFDISPALRVRKSEIRIVENTARVQLVDMDLDGACVSPGDVLRQYPDAIIIQRPSGHSLDERTYYATFQQQVRVSFGFTERNPGCLAAIIFDPAAS